MDRDLSVLLVAERDPRSGTLRRGPQLRLTNTPPGVSYVVMDMGPLYEAPPGYDLGGFLANAKGLLGAIKYTAVNQVARLLSRPLGDGYDLVHSFFLDLHRFSTTWVHESDQSPGQYFRSYVRVPEALYGTIVSIISDRLNSEECGAVITWTSWAAKGFINDGVDRSKVHVVPPPVKVGESRPHDGINVLFLGRDPYRKGLDIALKVVLRVARYFESLRALVVAPGLRPTRLLDGRVRLASSVPEDVLRSSVLPSTDIVLAPSRAEAYNMTVLEAMAYGAVPIVSSVGGLPKLVGEAGLVIDDIDEDQFTDALERVVADEALRSKLSWASRTLVRSRHSPELIGKAIYDIYVRALG